MGHTSASKEKMDAYLSNDSFELILLSIHHNGKYYFSASNDEIMAAHQITQGYVSLMLEGVYHVKGANGLAHFDDGLCNF